MFFGSLLVFFRINRTEKIRCRRHLKLHVIVTFYALFAFIYTTIVSS